MIVEIIDHCRIERRGHHRVAERATPFRALLLLASAVGFTPEQVRCIWSLRPNHLYFSGPALRWQATVVGSCAAPAAFDASPKCTTAGIASTVKVHASIHLEWTVQEC